MRPNSLFRPGALMVAAAMILMAPAAFAQTAPSGDGIFSTIFDNFQAGAGDNYSNLFFSLIFGPLFPNPLSGGDPGAQTLFSAVIVYFNYAVLAVMTILLLYNVTIGIAQSAHEGKPLGQRWSSLWAPIRVLFAYTLAIPVPTIGYNVAQIFVAWVAKGATWFASWLWGTAISLFVSGVVPISPPLQQIDPSAVAVIWENAACRSIVNSDQALAGIGDTRRITLVPSVVTEYRNSTTNNVTRYEYVSRTEGNHMWGRDRCGSFGTPEVPLYVTQREEGVSIIPNAATATQVETAFSEGHRSIAVAFVTEMSQIADDYIDVMRDPASPLPVNAVAARLRAAMNQANSGIGTLNQNIMGMAVGVDSDAGNAARQAMISRITGGTGCTYATNGNAIGSDSCFGEGWIGAGAWYMTIARLNSELSSLMQSSLRAEPQGHITSGRRGDRNEVLSSQRVIANGGELDADASAALQNSQRMVMARYDETFRQAANQLAAYGFRLSTEDAAELSHVGQGDDNNWFTRMMRRVADTIREAMFGFMQYIDPNLNGLDPMANIASLGHTMITLVTTIMAIDIAVDGISWWSVTMPLLAAGVFLAYVLPMLPFIFWVLGVVGYFLIVVEAVVAMPLWALGHMRLDGEGVSGESGRIGWMMLLAIMITPALMVLGYLVGMIIFRVGVIIINMGIVPLSSSLMSGSVVSSVFGFIAIAVMLCLLYLFMLERSFSLIATLSSKVLRVLNGGADVLDGQDLQRGRAVAAAGSGAMLSGAKMASPVAGPGMKMIRNRMGGGSTSATG